VDERDLSIPSVFEHLTPGGRRDSALRARLKSAKPKSYVAFMDSAAGAVLHGDVIELDGGATKGL
jgi:hypothetical protein